MADLTATTETTDPTTQDVAADVEQTDASGTSVEAQSLVEDVSIDGMCGVY